ncbi:MAG: glycosyltransferase [Anaerolineae bacterium]
MAAFLANQGEPAWADAQGHLTVSVVIPAYNAANSLPACLAALLRQTVAPNEVIVVDDGSADDTASVASQWGVRVVSQKHSGPAAARNLGVANCFGNIVLFTDADCEPTVDWLAQMLSPFSDRAVAGVKGAYRTHQRQIVARLAQCEFEERYQLLARSPTIDFVDSYSAAFRTSLLRAVGGFDPAFPEANNEDVDLSYRLARQGHKLVFNPRAIVYHRHKAAWLPYLRLKAKRGYWRMLVYRRYPGKALSDSYTPQLLKLQVLLAFASLGAAALAILWPPMFWLPLATVALLLLTSLPYTRLVWRLDRAITPWAPVFVVARALAFAVGVAAGAISILLASLLPSAHRRQGDSHVV